MSEGMRKLVGLAIFGALIVAGIVGSDASDDSAVTRNAAIPLWDMGGEEEPPPPSDKALAKLEDKINEMGEMILELAAQMDNMGPVQEAGNPQDIEQVRSQITDLSQELRLTNQRIVSARTESLLRDRGCDRSRGNEDEPWNWPVDQGNLGGGQFSYEDLAGADLHNASLTWSVFNGANLVGTDFSGAHLTGAHLSQANLQGANFTDARLAGWLNGDEPGANFMQADLRGANFRGAVLGAGAGYGPRGANFMQADLTGADFTGATFADFANFEGANLTDVIGLP